jgi:uncharacterized membrane-anchored protein YjiN (DUF445 family)
LINTLFYIGAIHPKFYLGKNLVNLIAEYVGGFGKELKESDLDELKELYRKKTILQKMKLNADKNKMELAENIKKNVMNVEERIMVDKKLSAQLSHYVQEGVKFETAAHSLGLAAPAAHMQTQQQQSTLPTLSPLHLQLSTTIKTTVDPDHTTQHAHLDSLN